MQYDSTNPLTIILGIMARDYGLNPDKITIVTNKLLSGRRVGRYTFKGEKKYQITLGHEFTTMLDKGNIPEIQKELGECLRLLNSAHNTKLDVPIVRVRDEDFEWEFVIRAKHSSGIQITKVSSFPHFMEMKQEIHEETATVLESLARGK